MEVYSTLNNGNLIFALVGELDEHTAELVRRKIDERLSTQNYTAVTLDLSRLSFMDSTGIGVIIGRYKQLKRRNIPLCVTKPSPTIDKIFSMSGLYTVIGRI